MQNISFQQRSLSYSQVSLNNKQMEKVSNYNMTLQNKLDLVGELIDSSFLKLINYTYNLLDEREDIGSNLYELGMLSDIVKEYSHILKNGVPLLHTMSNQLKGKKLYKASFELLLQIINYQIDTTLEIVGKELSIERIDVVFSHLRDVPYYLRADLEIENLPDVPLMERTIKNPNRNKWEIVANDYNIVA